MNLKNLLPIPDLLEAKNVLAVFPHPDDAELTAGGTVALLSDKGARVTYCLATDGSMGTFDPRMTRDDVANVRRQEQLDAARMLGVGGVRWLGFSDGFLPEIEAVRQKIVTVIREVRPDFLITLDPWLTYEAHPDHRKTGLAAVEAALYAAFPLAYPDDLSAGLAPHSIPGIALVLSAHPNTFIDITAAWDRKMAACLCHKSQFPEPMWSGMYEPYIRAKSTEAGSAIGAVYAEEFKVVTAAHLHVMTDTWRM